MDKDWLNKMFEEAGLDPKRARQAARVVLERILRRDQGSVSPTRAQNIRTALVKDPLVSFNRIIGRGDGGLPFVDVEEGCLSSIGLASAFTDAGIDPAVATAYAKVVAEAYGPEEFYQEVWRGLGRTDPVVLDELTRMDWTPLRREFPEMKIQPSDQRPTEVVPIFAVTGDEAAKRGSDPLDAGPPRKKGPSPRTTRNPSAAPSAPNPASASAPSRGTDAKGPSLKRRRPMKPKK